MVPLLCLTVLAAALAPILTRSWALAPFYDTPNLTSPLFCEVGRHFLQGRFPLFDWTILEPVSHNAHFSPIYPLYLAGVVDFCDLGSSIAGHDVLGVLHVLLMFANAFILGRVAGLPPAGATFAALVFAVSPNAFVLAQWPDLIAAAAWVPLAAAGLLAVLYRGHLLCGIALTSLGFGLMLVAAPANNLTASFVAFGLMLGIGALAAAIANGTSHKLILPWILCAAASAGAVALIATGTTGNLLVALDDLIRWNRTGYVIGTQVTSEFRREILFEQRGILDLASVLLPLRVPFAVGSFFIGFIVACLALLGAWDGRREWLVRTFAGMAGACLVLVFLDPVGLALAWAYIPGLSHTRHLSLLGGPFMIAAALLAARGLAVVLRPEARRARRAMGLVLIAAAPISLMVFAALFFIASDSSFGPERIATVIGTGLLGMALLRRGDRLAAEQPARLAALIVLGCAVVTVPALYSRLRSIDESQLANPTWQDLDHMVERLVAADPEPGVFVFHGNITADGFQYTTAGTAARLHGAATFQYFHSPRVHWKFFAQNYLFPDYAAYARLGGRYLLSEGPLEDPLLEPMGRERSIYAYRLRGSRPMVVATCDIPPPMQSPSEGLSHLRPSQLPLAPTGLLEAGRAADAAPHPCPAGTVNGLRIDRSKDALRFELAPAGARMLVLNVPPYEGWRLTIGGRGIPLFALDDSRLVAAVPADVSGPAALIFRPIAVMVRMGVSVLSLALLIPLFAWLAWRRPGSSLLGWPGWPGRSTRPADFLQRSAQDRPSPGAPSTGQ